MYDIKQNLREEIYLYNRKKLLSEQSLLLIENDYYVNTTLGIDKLSFKNDTYNYKKLVIEQQIIIENILTSINNYLGNVVQKGKEKSLQIVKTVNNLKDLALLFKNILVDPKLMEEAIENVKKSLTKTITEVKNLINNLLGKLSINIEGFTDKLNTFLNKILEFGDRFLNSKGWVGFLTMLGLTVMLIWLKKNWLENLFNLISSSVENQIKNINFVINIFNGLKDLINNAATNMGIEEILNWFINFGKKEPIIGIVFSASQIIDIISEILVPTVKTIANKINLNKT